MIPVQKSFPPSLLRRWRKVMRETPKICPICFGFGSASDHIADNWLATKNHSRELRVDQRQQSFDRWKLSQQRQSWLYAAIGGAVLALIIFLVCGGCHAPRA